MWKSLFTPGANASFSVDVFNSGALAASAAAHAAAAFLRDRLERQGELRIMVGTGNSQLEMIRTLVRLRDVTGASSMSFPSTDTQGSPPIIRRVSPLDPAQLRQKVRPHSIHYIEGDAADLDGMLRSYSQQLLAGPIDLAFVGIGENGHIAFNDPHVADFNDPQVVKCVALDGAAASRSAKGISRRSTACRRKRSR